MDVQELIERAPAFVSVIGALGIALLLPLYLSQRRDVQRLRAWMNREPEHPAADIAASEAILDRAEVELEELVGAETGSSEAVGATPSSGTEVMPAAARVTSERPALERVTIERAALAPHPRWRRFLARATQPRVLVVVGILALLLAAAGIFLSESFLADGGDDDERGAKVAKINRSEVTVTVLNGTSVTGLAQKVGSDVGSNGYDLGAITSTTPDFEKTVVLFANGERKAAKKVARDLGLDPGSVESLDQETKLLAGEADVVVIAGDDRAKS